MRTKLGQKMVQLDLCFPITFKQKRAHECSNKQILRIKVLKMGMFRTLANKWLLYGMTAFYLFYKQPSVYLLLAMLTAQKAGETKRK